MKRKDGMYVKMSHEGMIHEGRSKRKVYALCTMHYAPNNLHYGDVWEEREFEMQRMNVSECYRDDPRTKKREEMRRGRECMH